MITRDDAEKYLSQYSDLLQAIAAKREQILTLQELATKTTSTLKDVVVQSGSNDGHAGAVVSWIGIEFTISREIFLLEAVRLEIGERLGNMRKENALLANVLELRFLNDLGWDDVAGRLGYSVAHMYSLRAQALDMFIGYMDIDKKKLG